jgi:post-segregation antitoxin (ccd killing protein)
MTTIIGNKEIHTFSLDIDVCSRAKELGINCSFVCNKALKEEITRREREERKG